MSHCFCGLSRCTIIASHVPLVRVCQAHRPAQAVDTRPNLVYLRKCLNHVLTEPQTARLACTRGLCIHFDGGFMERVPDTLQ